MNYPTDPGWHNVKFVLVGQSSGEILTLYGQVPDSGDTPLCDPRIMYIITNGINLSGEGGNDGSEGIDGRRN
jgi:hypothetical protein